MFMSSEPPVDPKNGPKSATLIKKNFLTVMVERGQL